MVIRIGPRVDIDASGNPVFIDTLPADLLRAIKPTNPIDITKIHEFRAVYGLEDPSALRQFETQYLGRFNINPLNADGTANPRYKEALNQLTTESNSQRVAVAQARRTVQRTELIGSVRGNLKQNAIYVNDDDPCSPCEDLNGLEQTILEFEENNESPGDVCLGGDNCRCILVPVN